jgi:alkylation response protein AidB-like acyl-CoA dehydrogenase
MSKIIGPEGLATRLAPAIRDLSEELDRSDNVPEKLLEQLRELGAFRLLTPRELGGSETPLTTLLPMYEELSRLDASVAWVVWNANFGFVAAMLPASGVAKIWSGRGEPMFANGGSPGQAVPVEGGYRLSGRWQVVSGIDVADWVCLVAIVMEGGAPRLTEENAPEVAIFLVPTDAVAVEHTWHVNGMRATGSNSVTVEDLLVPSDLVARIDRPSRIDSPIYQGFIPALVLPGCTAVVLGLAQGAIDEATRLAATKKSVGAPTVLAEQPRIQAIIASSEADLRAARLLLFDTARIVEEAGPEVTLEQRADLRSAMSHAAQVSRRVLVAMYELASSSSVYLGSPLERYLRDGMVALQHVNHHAIAFEGAGRVRFGFEAGLPLF